MRWIPPACLLPSFFSFRQFGSLRTGLLRLSPLIGTCLLAVGLVACQSQGQEGGQEAVDKEQVIASLDSAELGSVFVKGVEEGDFDAQASIYAEDAIYSHPTAPPVRGRDSIRAVLKQMTPSGATADIQTIDRRAVGPDAAYSYGTVTYSYTPEGAGQPQEMTSTYLALFQRTEEGWKITREALSSNHKPADFQ